MNLHAVPSLSPTEHVVLRLLATQAESYPLELIRLSGGRLKRGGIYVIMDRMETKGFVASYFEQPSSANDKFRIPRKLFKLTLLGQGVLAEREAALKVFASTS